MWIDMACINQTDVGEKASQIPLMRRIYSQAAAVIIWINEYDSHLRYAFYYLRRVIRWTPGRQDKHDWPLFEPMGFDSIQRLLDCQWFHRRWVIQEATVPRHAIFLCGADALTMEDLFSGIDISLKDHRQLKLLWLLENLRLKQSALPCDKIYGLLGFCSSEEAAGNPVHYHLGPEEAYKTFVVTHANLHIQRDTVCRDELGHQQCRRFSAPSWVPNWDSKSLRRCLGLSHLSYDEKYFDASGTLSVDYSFNANELVVSGVMLDRIQVLGDFVQVERRAEFSDPSSRIFQQYFDFYMTRPIGETPYTDELSRAKAFSRTISLFGVYLTPVPSSDELPEMFYHWCQGSILGSQLEERGLKYQASQRDGLKGFMRMKRLLSWQPFITQRGYIGLVREKCGVGDEVWIVGGCSVPVLLSPMAKNEHNREVRGEVLLDGFMFGEITKDPSSPPVIEKVVLA
ncbi:heterokaryon incompatibility protein-domain-containing protein [Xylaria digitata]|nr:heterokaryon incompatibility protein-domain-containing protein [Xylaria digitata]